MKKAAVLVFMLLFMSISASAEGIPIRFHKTEDGQYIYCNNPEFISEKDLSTDENPNPTYMMKNEQLKPDNYSVFFCFYNWTDFDVEPDIEFVSDNNAVITINSIGYYLPQEYDYWDCVGAWADLLNVNIHTLNNYMPYVPYKNTKLPVTIKLKDASEWISSHIYNYEPVAPKVTFNMLVNFTIESGTADVNFAALKNYGIVGSRAHHVSSAAPGTYKNDTSIKGIEPDSAPIVESDLDIDITPEMPDGERIGVKIFNQYYPEGNESDFWMTNINASRDMYAYSKGAAVGSDMLSFHFKDKTKLDYYGENAENKNDEWIFDIYHYNTQEYQSNMPWAKEEHEPNAYMGETLDINNLPNLNYQFNLGNFGVANRYNMTITNSDVHPRTLNYMLETSVSSNIIIVYDENGNMLNPYTLKPQKPFALCKGTHYAKKEDCMLSIPISAGKTVKYTVDVILPTNCFGGIVNYLIPDTKSYLKAESLTELPEYTEFNQYKNTFFNGETQMRWEDGKLYRNNMGRWQQVRLPESAAEIFGSRSRDMQICKTSSGYAARFAAWDEYGNNIEDTSTANRVYLFDSKFNYIDTVMFENYVKNMVYSNGVLYANVRDKIYISKDGLTFENTNSGYDMPRVSGEYSIFKKDEELFIDDGDDFAGLAFESNPPSEIYCAGGVFYRRLSWKNYDNDTQTGNVLAVSRDGVNWTTLYLPNRLIKLKTMEYINNTLYVYTKYETFEFKDVFPKDNIKVKLNGEYLSFDVPAKIINDRTMVPIRFLFEKLDAEVEWIDATREIAVTNGDTEIRMQIDNTVVTVNGEAVEIDTPPLIDNDKTLIPIRFISENLGYSVDWNQERQTAVINRHFIKK